MIGALGTLLFFALTPVFANRAAHRLGSLHANCLRLVIAVVLLGAWSHLAGRGLGGGALGWFVFGGMVGFVGHLTVADGTIVTGLTMVSHSIHTGGVYSSGLPAEDGVKWRRTVAHLKRLDKLVSRVKALEGATGLAGAAGEDTDHAEKEAE